VRIIILLCLLFIGCARVGDPCVVFAIPDESKDKAAKYALDLLNSGRTGPNKAMQMAREMYGKQMSGKMVKMPDGSTECSCAGKSSY
jgi:hypothetical protein